MSQVKNLVEQIREYEASARVAKMTNERELPLLKSLLDNLDDFGFSDEDADLKLDLTRVAGKIAELEVDDITAETLDLVRTEVDRIREELVSRYQERMEGYATRQSHI